MTNQIEIVPTILRNTFEEIESDWAQVKNISAHIQIDITDGVFAGNGTYRDIPRFKQLPESEKIEMHMMVHNPSYYVDDLIDLTPARIIFHLEAFSGNKDVEFVYQKLREETQAELAIAINPSTPNERLEQLTDLIDYAMFLGVEPGYTNQPFAPVVFNKVGLFHDQHPDKPIAVDGHVNKETIGELTQAGANILCANTAIFKEGNPKENIDQLKLLAQAALE